MIQKTFSKNQHSNFSLAGFGDPLAFKSIGEKEIHDIEIWNSSSQSSFNFRPGDVIYIQALVSHVKRVVDGNGENSGLSHFVAPNAMQLPSEIPKISHESERIETKSHYFLKKLLSAADRNLNREKGGYRYDNDVKHFAAFLRMIIGPLAYEVLQKNLVHSLPTLSSCNRYIQASGCHVTEGILRCEELAIYLSERSLEPVVCLSEDATRIVGRVQYDSRTNQLMGFVQPINKKNGMPIPFMYPARDADEMWSHFANNKCSASFLNVIMAQPIANVPAFCLLVFSSDNKYTSNDVKNRWTYITEELEKVKINVLTISSDSDTKYNKAMRMISGLGMKTIIDWFSIRENSNGPFCIQDLIHIATKMRNFLLRTINNKKKVPFGKGFIHINYLYELLNMFSKDKHQLTPSTLNPTDRQNFKSVIKICHKRVTDLLRDHIKNSESTIQYLQLLRNIIESFMEHDLTPLQRIRKCWYAVFLIRIWRQFILSSDGYTLKDNFLTANCYSCIELNAHNLVQCMLYLRKINKPELFKPFLYESQPCESLFRQLRSLSTVYCTVTNCTVKEATSRISNIQLQNHIMHLTSQNFEYPRFSKAPFVQNNITLPSQDEIIKEIEFCQTLAIATAKQHGLIRKNDSKCRNYECKIKPATELATLRLKKKKENESHDSSFEISSIQLTSDDLKNIQLKNYANKVKRDDIDGVGPYIEIKCSDNKKVVVKKTSFCWLLGTETKKVSNDRLRRVMHTNKESRLKKQIQQNSLHFPRYKKRIMKKQNKKYT